jgi:hypothetical protein
VQFQIVARGRNSASDNCCAINRSIRIQWHSVNQFLASRNTYGTFKQTGLRYSSSQFCHCVIGRVDVVRRVRGGWPQMILLFFIMRCTPTIRELIVATPLSLSSPSATGLSALAPAQRAGAQRLCALALSCRSGMSAGQSLSGVNRTSRGRPFRSHMTQHGCSTFGRLA